MIEAQASVVAKNGQNIILELHQMKSGCGNCSQNSCSQSVLGQFFKQKKQTFDVESDLPVVVGDSVTVGFDESSLQSLALIMYGLPIVAMIVGAALPETEPMSIFAGLSGIVIGILSAKVLGEKLRLSKRYQIKLLSIS